MSMSGAETMRKKFKSHLIEGTVVREYDDTPHDFGRIATMTAQVQQVEDRAEIDEEWIVGIAYHDEAVSA